MTLDLLLLAIFVAIFGAATVLMIRRVRQVRARPRRYPRAERSYGAAETVATFTTDVQAFDVFSPDYPSISHDTSCVESTAGFDHGCDSGGGDSGGGFD
jgi:hypothetical protein